MNEGFYEAGPELRATVTRRGDVVMTRWSPGAARPGGPAASQLRLRKLAGVFDLTIERESVDGITIATDLLVGDVFLADDSALAYEKLIAWAASLGYHRVWLSHEVVALEPNLLGGTWETTCRHCGSTWSDSTAGFWLNARAAGFYPPVCSLCSHPLVQPVAQNVGPVVRGSCGM
jgi:hypothetical protein